MKKWGGLLAGIMIVVGLALPARVLAAFGEEHCPCGHSGGGCASCVGQTDTNDTLFCESGRGHASDPLCDKGKESSCSVCPAGTVKTCYKDSPIYSGSALYRNCGCGKETGSIWLGGTQYYKCQTIWGCVKEKCNKNGACWCVGWGWTTGECTTCFMCSCVPTCSSSAPAPATLLSPSDNSVLSTTSVTLSWGAPASWGKACAGNQNVYHLFLWDSEQKTWNVVATLAAEVTTYNLTVKRGLTYVWYVRTYNGEKLTTTNSFAFRVTDGVTGRVYLDTDNTCSTSNPWNLGGVRVALQGTGYSGVVERDGTYVVGGELEAGTYTLELENIPNGYVCVDACGGGCPIKTGVVNPSGGHNFYLSSKREAWWQAFGASLYAGGSVRSQIPSSSQYLIEPGVGGAVGALLRSSGSVDTGSGEVSGPGYSTISRYRGKTMNYDFFAAQMGVTRNTKNDWGTNLLNKPANNPERNFYYIKPTGSEATVAEEWHVLNGESYVVFVNGNLRIASDITVEPGGFLAFIVNGDIAVSPAVAQVQGLYVADEALITESNGTTDVQLGFEGSIVAWGGVTLGRDLGTNNVNNPAETFTYRPDLLVNMPEKMKVFVLRWKEVVPGTFGN